MRITRKRRIWATSRLTKIVGSVIDFCLGYPEIGVAKSPRKPLAPSLAPAGFAWTDTCLTAMHSNATGIPVAATASSALRWMGLFRTLRIQYAGLSGAELLCRGRAIPEWTASAHGLCRSVASAAAHGEHVDPYRCYRHQNHGDPVPLDSCARLGYRTGKSENLFALIA